MRRRTFLAFATSTALGGCLSGVPGDDSPVDVGCPSFSENADSLCSHTDDPELTLRPSSWKLADGANASAKFTLSNDADETIRFAEIPMVKRRTDDGWNHLWPTRVPPLERHLEPKSSFSWELGFSRTVADYDADQHVESYELESGTYAAVVGAEIGDRWVQCVAPFAVGDEDV